MEKNVIGIPSELLNVFWYATEGTEREQNKSESQKPQTNSEYNLLFQIEKAWQLTLAAETVELITTAEAKMLSEKMAK